MSEIKKEIDQKNAELKITVPIAEDVWVKEQKKAFDKIAKKVKVEGFRPGKAPIQKLKERISTVAVWEEAISKLLTSAVKDAAKEIDDKTIVLDSPTYVVEKATETELEIIFIYPIYPEIKVKEYKKLGIKFKEATEKEIKEGVKDQIDKLLSRRAVLLPKEGNDAKVENGDTITFDFKGFMDGEAFSGGEAEGYVLKIGSKQFIPGFEDQLVGKKLGWEGSINVTFPADYYKEDFRNKEAKFEIKISEIKYEDKPKLDETFIKSLSIPNVSNEKELNDYLFDLTKKEMHEKSRVAFMDELIKKVIDENDIPVPRTIALKELQALQKRFKDNLKQQDITEKEYYEVTGYNDEKVKEELLNEANRSIKKSLLLTFFTKDLDIKVSEEDLERQYQRIAKLYNIDDIQTVRSMMKREIIEPQIMNELVIDKLITLNNPDVKIVKEKVELPPKTEKKSTEKTEKTEKKEEAKS